MTPRQLYQQHIDQQRIEQNPDQAAVIDQLQIIFDQLTASPSISARFLRSLRQLAGFYPWSGKTKLRAAYAPVKGLYLWGEVGCGKTYLMDLFYDCLPFATKLRAHFHHFMKQLHDELAALSPIQDPLAIVAARLARQARVLCFDEFQVTDIADAMLLARLLAMLVKQGVCLVMTSNRAPDQLYWRGLQRANFLPAIELIKQCTTVLRLESGRDYRLRHMHYTGVYHYPLNTTTTVKISEIFHQLGGLTVSDEKFLTVLDRAVPVRGIADHVVWFDFRVICGIPRSPLDFIAIAQRFNSVIITDIPLLRAQDREAVRYLINLVDVFYDAHTRLILSAACPLDNLYQEGSLLNEFQRTKSRLVEMQSAHYWHSQIY